METQFEIPTGRTYDYEQVLVCTLLNTVEDVDGDMVHTYEVFDASRGIKCVIAFWDIFGDAPQEEIEQEIMAAYDQGNYQEI